MRRSFAPARLPTFTEVHQAHILRQPADGLHDLAGRVPVARGATGGYGGRLMSGARPFDPEYLRLVKEVELRIVEVLNDMISEKDLPIDVLLRGTLLAFNDILLYSQRIHPWTIETYSQLMDFLSKEVHAISELMAEPTGITPGMSPKLESPQGPDLTGLLTNKSSKLLGGG